jgi:hypothetical protein
MATLGLMLVYSFYDLSGIVSQPLIINGTPLSLPGRFGGVETGGPPDLGAVETLASGAAKIEVVNPLDPQILSTLFPTPVPTMTPTPVPPLDPLVYRTEVMIRAKNFGSALEAFLNANERLSENNALLDDPTWRTEMGAILDQLGSTGKGLAEVGPPPDEYQAIDALLKRVGTEAEGLRSNYSQALETGDTRFFTAAGENFNHIKEYLYAALEEMARAGWPAE